MFPSYLIRVLYSFIFRLMRSVLVTVAFYKKKKEIEKRKTKAGVRRVDEI